MKESVVFSFKPNGNEISTVRKKSEQLLQSFGLPKSTVEQQTAILSELIAYGKGLGNVVVDNNQIEIKISIDNQKIILTLSRPIHESDLEDLDALDRTIQFIRGYQDPFDAFSKLKAASNPNARNRTNEMPLAKAANEGQAQLDFFVNDDNMLIVWALCSLELN